MNYLCCLLLLVCVCVNCAFSIRHTLPPHRSAMHTLHFRSYLHFSSCRLNRGDVNNDNNRKNLLRMNEWYLIQLTYADHLNIN